MPLEVLDMSHSEDVTSVRFHPDPAYHQRVLTCSTDCLVNFFDFAGKASMSEDDGVAEAIYRSEQPLLDCGFTCSKRDGEKFYALTAVGTLELCHMEPSDENLFFTSITRFPHVVHYIIGVQVMALPGSEPKTVLHAGNNNGEVFLYEVDLTKK